MSPNEQPNPVKDEPASERQGFALATALLALVVVGALVTGSFFAASQEREMGLSARYNDDGLYVAETALQTVIAEQPRSFFTSLTTTQELPAITVTAGGTTIGNARVWARPTGPNNYMLVASGIPARGGRAVGGGRTLGMLVRLLNVSFPPARALQVFGETHVQGSALISGQDTKPASGSQWDTCTVRTGTDTAIVANSAALIDVQKATSITGPIVRHDLDMSNFLSYGDVNFDQLAAMANKKYLGTSPGNPLPSGTATTCDTGIQDNWGEPYNTVLGCVNYFPLIYIDHSVSLQGNGRGQGILLVNGDLELTGGFEFWGVTVVKGALNMHGNGGHVNGVVLAYQEGQLNYDENLAIGNSLVQFSGCAVRRAISGMGAARTVPVRMHSWFDLSAAGANADF